jgi:type VI secretion system secreted protein Hcp
MAIYMQMGGVPGTATDSDFTGWVVLTSVHWGIHVDVSTTVGASGNRLSAGKITPSDVSMQKEFDLATVPLLKLAFAGTNTATATIAITQQATNSGAAYLTYTLTDVIVSSFNQGSGADGTPTDSFTLNFSKVEIKASPTDMTGQPVNSIGGYDFAKSLPM